MSGNALICFLQFSICSSALSRVPTRVIQTRTSALACTLLEVLIDIPVFSGWSALSHLALHDHRLTRQKVDNHLLRRSSRLRLVGHPYHVVQPLWTCLQLVRSAGNPDASTVNPRLLPSSWRRSLTCLVSLSFVEKWLANQQVPERRTLFLRQAPQEQLPSVMFSVFQGRMNGLITATNPPAH